MELSAAFEERVRQMEDARNHRLALLNVSYAAPLLILNPLISLSETLQTLAPPASPRRLFPPFPLMRRPRRRSRPPSSAFSPPSSPPRADSSAAASSSSAAPPTSPPAPSPPAPTSTPHARAGSSSPATSDSTSACSNRARSSVRGEIEEAERREEDWDRFYEAKRKELEEFHAESRRFEAGTREEVQRLRDSVSQLKFTLQELQTSAIYSNNTEIAAAEARKSDLTAKKAKMGESLASARQFRALLQQQLQKAFQSQVDNGDQKEAQATI